MTVLSNIGGTISAKEFLEFSFEKAESFIKEANVDFYTNFLSHSKMLKEAFPLSDLFKLIINIEDKKVLTIKEKLYGIYTCDEGYLVKSKNVKKRTYTNKKTQSALLIPFNDFMKSKEVLRLRIRSDKSCTPLKGEIETLLKYQNHEGHVPCYRVDTYKKLDVDKAELFVEKLDGPLNSLVEGTVSLEIDDLLVILMDIAAAIDDMHETGDLHGDISPRNMLFGKRNKQYVGAICDYGFSTKIDTKNDLVKRGIYGAARYTAPELFGLKKFQGDMKKVEIFALGLSFYEIIERWLPNWTRIPAGWLISDNDINEESIKTYQESVQKFVAEEKEKNKKCDQELREVQLKKLILEMIELDPKKRPSFQEIADGLSHIKSYCL